MVARAVAKEMNLSDVEIETAEIAGNLLNLGKILIPEAVLKKTEGLTDEERGMIRNSIMTSAELIKGIEFDGPVVETLQQAQANYDGTGNPPLKEQRDRRHRPGHRRRQRLHRHDQRPRLPPGAVDRPGDRGADQGDGQGVRPHGWSPP